MWCAQAGGVPAADWYDLTTPRWVPCFLKGSKERRQAGRPHLISLAMPVKGLGPQLSQAILDGPRHAHERGIAAVPQPQHAEAYASKGARLSRWGPWRGMRQPGGMVRTHVMQDFTCSGQLTTKTFVVWRERSVAERASGGCEGPLPSTCSSCRQDTGRSHHVFEEVRSIFGWIALSRAGTREHQQRRVLR